MKIKNDLKIFMLCQLLMLMQLHWLKGECCAPLLSGVLAMSSHSGWVKSVSHPQSKYLTEQLHLLWHVFFVHLSEADFSLTSSCCSFIEAIFISNHFFISVTVQPMGDTAVTALVIFSHSFPLALLLMPLKTKTCLLWISENSTSISELFTSNVEK